MLIFKCKSCAGGLDVVEGATIAECKCCGLKQTVPKLMDENMQNLFNRANILRIKGEFDKAAQIYERIIQADSAQADAYWGLILCKYGIEYVDDPKTLKKIPTCHRASYDSIIADEDYKFAIENADFSQRLLYEEQAKEIDRIQKEILALAQKEETYDIFICYKETDENGQRTLDSSIANDIYYQLKDAGYKVFYAAITLEGKLGKAYEPIIFAALNSAKVMLAIGTKPEYFNAVWVKNEWSRFLKIIQKDRSKLLIPCYRDMDAYELPEEFVHLQAQDMSKIGFINDLVRGIKKVVNKTETTEAVEASKAQNNPFDAQLTRISLFLEDKEFELADEFCEQILNTDPKNAEAYICKMLIEFKCRTKDELSLLKTSIANSKNYSKVIRFGNDEQIAYVKGAEDSIQAYLKKVREEEERKQEEERQRAEELKHQQEEELKREQEEELKRKQEEERKKAEELKRKQEEERQRAEELKRQQEEELKRKQEEERKRAEELKRKQEEEAKRESSAGLEFLLNKDGKGYILTKVGSCKEQDIVIGTYKGLPVTSIGDSAFRWCSNLTSITIPNSVTSIGDWAFSCCSNLTSITIPNSVTSIGNSAFSHCSNLTSITIPNSVTSIGDSAFRWCSNLTSITIPNSVTSIGSSAFSWCSNLTSITIPNSVTSIGDSAFSRCSNLTSITIPNSVTSIGGFAFYECYNLTSITIPNSVTSIGEDAFSSCSKLTNISVDVNNTKYKSINGNVYTKDEKTLVCYAVGKTDKSFTIPNSVTSIGDSAFSRCYNLTSITIPNSVTSISNSAFSGCINLTSITIPNSVTSIGNWAFQYCSNLTSITIPNSVTSIGGFAFERCYNLTSITIPNSVTSIGRGAFFKCSNLTSIFCFDNWDNIVGIKYAGIPKKTKIFHYSEKKPRLRLFKRYWHYVDGVPTEW